MMHAYLIGGPRDLEKVTVEQLHPYLYFNVASPKMPAGSNAEIKPVDINIERVCYAMRGSVSVVHGSDTRCAAYFYEGPVAQSSAVMHPDKVKKLVLARFPYAGCRQHVSPQNSRMFVVNEKNTILGFGDNEDAAWLDALRSINAQEGMPYVDLKKLGPHGLPDF